MCSVQLIFFILRHRPTFISKASNLVMSSFLIVLIYTQYKVTLQISVFAILFNPPLGNSFLLEKASFPLLSKGVNPGAEGRDPQILGRGSQGGRWSRERVMKYYYIVSCTGGMFESGYFEGK